jgi:hypothetical protein
MFNLLYMLDHVRLLQTHHIPAISLARFFAASMGIPSWMFGVSGYNQYLVVKPFPQQLLAKPIISSPTIKRGRTNDVSHVFQLYPSF